MGSFSNSVTVNVRKEQERNLLQGSTVSFHGLSYSMNAVYGQNATGQNATGQNATNQTVPDKTPRGKSTAG